MSNFISTLLSYDENRATVGELISAVNDAIANDEPSEYERLPYVVAHVELTNDEWATYWLLNDTDRLDVAERLTYNEEVTAHRVEIGFKVYVFVYYVKACGDASIKVFAAE